MRRLSQSALALALAFLVSPSVGAGEATRKAEPIPIRLGGTTLTTLRTPAEGFQKPFLHPIRTPAGVVISRSLEGDAVKDHPHHKGIWVAVDEVGGVRFWNENGYRTLDQYRVTENLPVGEPESATRLITVGRWMTDAKQPLVEVTTRYLFFDDSTIHVRITFKGDADEVTLGDTKEGLLGFRMANSMIEKETGVVVSSSGEKGTKALWGTQQQWIDYTGEVDGKTVGLALFDSPSNFRPSRYHVRNYGLFSISPFGEKAYTGGKQPAAPVTLKRGETLTVNYGVYIHDGDHKAADVAGAYRTFLERSDAAADK